MSIDLMKAERAFKAYISHYDGADDKIRLKIVHTFAVKKASEAIAQGLGLNEEDRALASLIGLLHDIGRFEQIRRFHTFYDDQSVDHAELGLEILFDGGKIKDFIEDRQYDALIYEAIANHNTFAIREGLGGRALLHAKLIRDADKLDNYRVKLHDSIETMLGVDAVALGASEMSDDVYEDAVHKMSILSSKRKTPMDIWASYIAVTFDIYFKDTLKIISDHEWVPKIIRRIEYTNAQSKKRMLDIEAVLLAWMKERIGSKDD